ncbi:MAG: hypothetical protein SFW67_17395 [Myxococcaceae bacterium]|nr:hypothetical protein [Myxococcaceae bacterium]
MAARKKAKRGAAPKAKKSSSKRAVRKVARAPAKKKPAPKRAKAPVKKPAPKNRLPVRKVPRSAVALPELPEIEGYVRSLPPPIVPLVNRLRRLVREAAPEAVELLDASGPAYAVNGLFARIEADGGVVRVRFMKGEQLDAPAGTLADASVSVTTFEELRENVLSSLVRQAVLLNVRDPSSSSGAV